MQRNMYKFLFLMVNRAAGTTKDELFKFFIGRVNLDTLWERYPLTTHGDYIHFRQDLISWNKLGVDPNIMLPVIGPLTTKQDVCGYGVSINIFPKS